MMYTDNEEMRIAKVRIQSLIKRGEAFALKTTEIPIHQVVEIARWNDEVVKFFMEMYRRSSLYGGKYEAKFDLELGCAANSGEKFAVLIQKLREQLEEINMGKDVLFRRLDLAERCQMAVMGATIEKA